MPSPDLVQFFTTVGIGGLLAWGMFLAYRKDMLAHVEAWKGQTQVLVEVVKENTAAVTTLTELIRKNGRG
jgi:hypothetical protein